MWGLCACVVRRLRSTCATRCAARARHTPNAPHVRCIPTTTTRHVHRMMCTTCPTPEHVRQPCMGHTLSSKQLKPPPPPFSARGGIPKSGYVVQHLRQEVEVRRRLGRVAFGPPPRPLLKPLSCTIGHQGERPRTSIGCAAAGLASLTRWPFRSAGPQTHGGQHSGATW